MVTLQVSDTGTYYWNEHGNHELIAGGEIQGRIDNYKRVTTNPRILIAGDDKAKFGPIVPSSTRSARPASTRFRSKPAFARPVIETRMTASISLVDYYTGAARRNKGDLFIGLVTAVVVIVGSAWIGEYLRGGPPKPKPADEVKTVQITMPNIEPDQEVQDTEQTSAPADIAPPMQSDVPQIVTDTSFVQPCSRPRPTT